VKSLGVLMDVLRVLKFPTSTHTLISESTRQQWIEGGVGIFLGGEGRTNFPQSFLD